MKTTLQDKRFEMWQKIELGTGLKTGADFYRALNEAGHEVYVHTVDMLLGLELSTNPRRKREVELVRIKFGELGLDPSPEKTSIIDICNQAAQFGLSTCAEVAPQLILQAKPTKYPGMEIWWEYVNLLIGMKPINHYGNPSVFFIGNLLEAGGYPLLCSHSAITVDSWDRYLWVFKRCEPQELHS